MKRKTLLAISGGAAAVAAGIVALVMFVPAQPRNDSAQAIYFFQSAEYRDQTSSFEWTDNVIGSGSKTDIETKFTCPAEATDVFVFLATPGQEYDVAKGWVAFAQNSFAGDTKTVLTPNFKPSGLVAGSPGASYIRRIGGEYSLGLACTKNAGTTVVAVSYRSIKIETETGKWTALAEPTISKP
jgi:hypothetical protein